MASSRPAASRACHSCRNAKVKCDAIRPVCGRCSRRNIPCFGYSDDVFRDQSASVSAAVQRRLRKSEREGSTEQRTFSVTPSEDSSVSPAPWLNAEARSDLPQVVVGDIDSRTVDFFFSNWIMYPCNHKISPGHLQDLPILYEESTPGSAIRLAIEAMAYGDLPDQHTKARSKYGAAIGRVRGSIADSHRNTTDSLLAALILIDTFELMHLGRSEPLGPHSVGLKHLLCVRGDGQLYNRRGFSLWRVAHHRLQARQILLRESPLPEQTEWVHKLNASQPDLHITTHVFEISKLCAQARSLLDRTVPMTEQTLQEVNLFLQKCFETIRECDQWTVEIADRWKPTIIPNKLFVDILRDIANVSLHHDVWVTYMTNFHAASRILAREAYLDVLACDHYQSAIPSGLDVEEATVAGVRFIRGCTKLILETMPQLLGFVDHDGKPRDSLRDVTGSKNGKGLGGFFALFSLMTINVSKHSPPQNKATAAKLFDWIHMQNSQL